MFFLFFVYVGLVTRIKSFDDDDDDDDVCYYAASLMSLSFSRRHDE